MKKFLRILTATDFSNNSQDALEYAVTLAKTFGSDLYLLHVFQEPITLPSAEDPSVRKRMAIVENRAKGKAAPELGEWLLDIQNEARAHLGSLVEEIRAQTPRVQSVFKTGTPYIEIVRAAEEVQADLIVLGTHGRTGIAHVMIGSVAERVVRNSSCPVLTVKPRRLDSPGGARGPRGQ